MRIRLMTLALTALTLLLPCTVAAKVICKKPTTLVQLKEAGDRGEKAFSDMDKTTLLSVAARA